MGRALQAGGRLREDLLPQAEAGDQQEGRQRRRLPQALGTELPLHGRPRRRLDHDRRGARAPRRHDGGQPLGRHHPDGAEDRARRIPLRAPAGLREPDLQPDLPGGAELLAAARGQLLGAQRDHPGPAVHGPLLAPRASGQRALRRAHPLARLCRGGAHAQGRLGRLARPRHRGQLRGGPARP